MLSPGEIFKLKIHQNAGALQWFPRTIAGFQEAASQQGRERVKGKGQEDREAVKGKGRGRGRERSPTAFLTIGCVNCFVFWFYFILFLLLPSYVIGFTVYNDYECVCAFVTYNKDYLLTYLLIYLHTYLLICAIKSKAINRTGNKVSWAWPAAAAATSCEMRLKLWTAKKFMMWYGVQQTTNTTVTMKIILVTRRTFLPPPPAPPQPAPLLLLWLLNRLPSSSESRLRCRRAAALPQPLATSDIITHRLLLLLPLQLQQLQQQQQQLCITVHRYWATTKITKRRQSGTANPLVDIDIV